MKPLILNASKNHLKTNPDVAMVLQWRNTMITIRQHLIIIAGQWLSELWLFIGASHPRQYVRVIIYKFW